MTTINADLERLHVLRQQLRLAACRCDRVDVARRAAEQRARRRLAAAGRGRRREQPAEAVVVDGPWEVERLAPFPHQNRPAPHAAFLPVALVAGGVAGLLVIVGRHELAEVPARPPCAEEEAARRTRDAACAGGRGAGHLADETRHGRRGRWALGGGGVGTRLAVAGRLQECRTDDQPRGSGQEIGIV